MSNTVSRQQWVFKTIYFGAWNLVIESPPRNVKKSLLYVHLANLEIKSFCSFDDLS